MPRAAILVAIVVGALLAAGCSEAGLGGADRPAAETAGSTSGRLIGPGGEPIEAEGGGPGPDFSVPALEGGDEIALADYRGKPLVLNFWASWCGPCKREMPDLVAFAAAHPGVAVLGLAVNDDPGDSRRFAERYDVPYDLGIDDGAEVAGEYGATGLPVTALLDRDGRIVSTWFGAIRRDDLEAFARRLGA